VTLQDELNSSRQEISTDSYQMSIGELVNIYKEGELNVHPEFQRFYRWTESQKSRWIESILLGIPLPSIFVAQREDGVWDLIDGLQRVSTILEFMGELVNEEGSLKPALSLEKTKYLPSLEGKYWSNEFGNNTLSQEQQRYVKRSKIDIKIILRESHEASKYELFQRLNTGGTFLSEQEVRSCLMISINPEFYNWLHELSQSEDFAAVVAVSENQIKEQYDLEIAVRFLVMRNLDEARIVTISELGDFLSDEVVRLAGLANEGSFDYDTEGRAFRTTFRVINESLGDDAFKKYDPGTDRFFGPFLVSAFEVIGLGIGHNHENYAEVEAEQVVRKVKDEVWAEPQFLTSSGMRATQRLRRSIPRGREVFGS